MPYAVKNFLEDNIIPEVKLLTVRERTENRFIQFSSIQKLPSADLLREHEFLICESQGSENMAEYLPAFVQTAVEVRASAVLWISENADEQFPAAVIKFAEKHRFPLLLATSGVSTAKIQADLKDAIQRQTLLDLETIQQMLFERFFVSFPLEDTGELIARTIGRPVRIIDPLGNIISEGQVHGTIPPKERTLHAPISINKVSYGEIRVHLDGADDPLWRRTKELEKNVALPLSLWFNRRNIEQVTQRRIRNDYIWNLANGNFNSLLEMKEQGKYLGFDLSKSYICIVMKAALEADSAASPVFSEETAEVANGIELLIRQEAKRIDRVALTARLNLDFVVFLESEANHSIESVHSFLDMVEGQISKQYPKAICLWGISEPISDKVDFKTSYEQASQALTYCLNARDGLSRFTYHRTRKAAIVAELSKSEEILKGADEVFSKLLAYDQTSQIDLLGTLTEFIANNYNASLTAKKLHLNRQSLLYRLDRIEQLTGMSLHDHDDLFVLEIFSRIYTSY